MVTLNQPNSARFWPLSSLPLVKVAGGQFGALISPIRNGIFEGETHFGFIHEGPTLLTCDSGEFMLKGGMYFSVPGSMHIGGGKGIVITCKSDYQGFFSLGGPVESRGRLRYIDGCTDSLIIAPIHRGDPCLNLLHIPPNTNQSSHSHPSFRIGLIIGGSGTCLMPEGSHLLEPGQAFHIPAGQIHSFQTDSKPLLVLAYHPDSDTGSTDFDHPMINRTFLQEKEV